LCVPVTADSGKAYTGAGSLTATLKSFAVGADITLSATFWALSG